MSVAAIIPVKPFAEGKSRLASVLTDKQRWTLNRNLYCHVLKTVVATPEIDAVLVISSDEEVLTLAEEAGAHAILEGEISNLNTALEIARKAGMTLNASALIVVPADLARLEIADITAMLTTAEQIDSSEAIVIAPDARHQGTNALLMRPVDTITFSFGENSFEMHQDIARQAGCNISIVERSNLSFDVDEPDDLKHLDEHFWRD